MSQKKVLVVDDSKVSRMMIRTRLQQIQPTWQVIEAASGDEAIALVARDAPDFITMDVNMPGISGFEAVERIRALPSAAPVALLTANIQEASRARAAALGVHFVQKPATEAALRQTVDYFLGSLS